LKVIVFGVPCRIFLLRAFNEVDKNSDLHILCSGVTDIVGGWSQSHIGICDHVKKVVLITCEDTSILKQRNISRSFTCLKHSRRLYPICFEVRVLYSLIIYSVYTSHPIITTSDNYFPKEYEEFFLYWRRS
jgi:hypothetical protein